MRDFTGEQIVLGHGGSGVAGVVRRGIVRNDFDDATGGVGTEGTGLSAPEDFDLLGIEERSGAAESGEVEVIDEETYGRVGRLAFKLGVFPDAADLEKAGAGSAAGPGEVGRGGDEIAEVLGAVGDELICAEDGGARADLGEFRRPQVGSDLERSELGSGTVLGGCRGGHRECEGETAESGGGE